MPNTAVAPKRPSTAGEISTGSGPSPAGAGSERPVSINAIARASRELRSRPPERSSSRRSRTPASGAHASISRVLGRDQHEARLLQRVGVRREHRQRRPAVAGAQLDLDAVDAPEHEALAGQRDLVPAPARRELVQAAVVLLRVRADAQVPRGALDQPHGVVTAPAQAVLDLDRRERRLARVAPVDVARAAVHQPGLQQRQEQPLRPAVHDRVGAHERALPVEREAQPLQLAGHVLGAARHPLARRHAAGDRAELRRQAEGVEAEREQHAIPARAPEARVGVSDGVAAHVADVHVARRERRRGLDVQVRLVVENGRRARGLALAPGRLAAGLDGVRVIARCSTPSLM